MHPVPPADGPLPCPSLLQKEFRANVATTMTTPMVSVGTMSDEDRAALAQQLGYKSIGKELPDGVTLTEIVKSMPPEVRGREQNRGGLARAAAGGGHHAYARPRGRFPRQKKQALASP